MDNQINKRGRATIFVIIALIVIGLIILFFFLFGNKTIELPQREKFEPDSFIRECLRESVREKTEIMIPQGGFVNPIDYKIYNDIKVAYLCKNINYYEPCVNQYPVYLTSLKKEIENNIKEDVEECSIALEDELDKRNYEFSGGEIEKIEATLKPEAIELSVFRDFSYGKGEETKGFDSFSSSIKSPLYKLGSVAQIIADQEAQFCYFEYVGYMNLNQEFIIRKWTMSDSTKIYTVTHKDSGAEMNIAIRGCAIPPGY